MKALYFFLLTYVLIQFGQAQPYNFIIIYTDDQRHETMGATGNEVILTPALDEFSERVVRFTQANVAFSLCSPSRAAMLTGRYGSANGVLHLGSGLEEGERTIAQYLREGGYRTGLTGKWHLRQQPSDLGFDFHVFFESNGTYYGRKVIDQGQELRPDEHCDAYCTDRAVDFLHETTGMEKPFFLWHCTQLPHMNGQLIWDARQSTKDRYLVDDMPVPSNRLDDLSGKPEYLKTVRNLTKARDYGYPAVGAIKTHTRDYYSVITEMDAFLEKLFQQLDQLGLWQNTYVFFMSDNGWMLGDHGFTSKVLPYLPSTKVPLMIAGPGLQPFTTNALVSNIDLLPTVLDIAGLPVPKNIHGKSLFPILRGKKKRVRKTFVYEGLGNYGGALPNLTVLDQDYRYIVTYTNETLTKVDFQELYDQQLDPLEINNLAEDPKFKSAVKKMHRAVKKHQSQVLD